MRPNRTKLQAVLLAGLTVCAVTGVARAEEAGADLDAGDFGQALANVIIFAILFLVLRKYAWGPILHQLKERERRVGEAVDRAEKRDEETQKLLKYYESKIESAEAEAQELLARGRAEAAEAREKILQTAREEAEKFAIQAKQDIRRASEAAQRELAETTAELATDIAAKVLDQHLSQAEHERLLSRSLAQVHADLDREPS